MRDKQAGWWAAVLGSLVLHGPVVVWLALHDDEPIKAHAVSAEFIFIEPSLPPAPPTPVAVDAPTPETPKKARPQIAPPRNVPAAATPSPPLQPQRSDRPEEAPRADTPTVRLSLLPGSSFALSLDAGIAMADDTTPQTGLRALEAPKDFVGGLAKETLGKGRVERGLVHPYYSQLGKTLLKNWDADRVAQSGLKGLAEQTQANLKLYNEIWAERASTYARSGNPLGDTTQTTNRRGAVNDRITGLPGVDLDQRKELQRQLREAYKSVRRALIRIVQDADGKLLKVELVQPSNDSKVDKEALIDVRAAAEKLPPPPPEALEGKDTLSSVWSYELVVSISPPVPTFTFEFDEALGFIDTRLPLDRRIYKKVRLVSVE